MEESRYADYVSVYVSDDEMSADIFFVEAPDDEFYELKEVLEFIADHGVVHGVKEDVIKEIIDEKRYGEFVHFAEGTPAKEPQNGVYDYKFNTSPSKAPKLLEDGSVDYYNLDLVETVEKGQLLAIYIPKKDGEDGTTVTGAPIAGKRAADLPALRGKGFVVSDDKTQYYADMDGKVELSMGSLNVSSMYTVSGDVDLSTGHIDFKGDLEITGNITAEMRVKATGNITVNGLVEAAYVEAGRDILIKGGILGGTKAVIKAGGNVYAQFIENAKIESNLSVQADSIINSEVNAYNDINVFGKTSCIVGGYLKANRYIKTKSIGTPAGVHTEVEVGLPNDCYVERKQYADRIAQSEEELAKLEKLLERLSKSGNDKSDMFLNATRTKIELTAEIFRHRSIVKELDNRINLGRYAEVVAEKRVCPGVRIKIDGLIYDVEDEYESILFFRKADRILSKKLDETEDIRKGQ